MKTWNCPECGGEMNLSMCQQGGFHVGCYDAYHDRPIKVWKVEHGGASFVDANFGNVADMLKDMDESSGYTVSVQTMEKGKYDRLKEFTGF